MLDVIKKLKEEVKALEESADAYRKHAAFSEESAIKFRDLANKDDEVRKQHITALDLIETQYYKQATG